MGVYGVFLQHLLRLNSLLTPAELQALNVNSSIHLFLVHNLFTLLLMGSGSVYMLRNVLAKKHTRMAMHIITSLFHLTAASTCSLLTVRHALFHKSYSGFLRYLRVGEEFRRAPLADSSYKAFVVGFYAVAMAWKTTASALELVAGYKDLWHTVSTVASQALTMLFALKLAVLSRHVQMQLLRANRLLSANIKLMNHSKFCPVSKAHFDKLVKFQWDCRDFLDKVNKAAGLEWFMLIFYCYVSLLFRLYNAALYSSVFTKEAPNVGIAVHNLGQALNSMMLSLVLLRNGTGVTKEAAKTTEIIWSAVPKVRCCDCRKRLSSFAIQISQLPVDMTARGVFSLNMKTFSNMISSAATQLVILTSLANQ